MERTEQLTQGSGPSAVLAGSYVDWPAILGGAVVATAIAALFSAFGAAIGLSAVSAQPGEGSLGFAVILSAIWLVVTLVASYSAGGYIAGRMRRRVDSATADEVTARDGINGLVVWGVGMIVGAVLIGSAVSTTVSAVGTATSAAGSAVGTAVSAAGQAVGGIAQGALAAAGAIVPDAAKQDPMGFVNDTLLRPATVTPQTATSPDLARETTAILANVMQTGELSDSERTYLQGVVAARTGLPPAQVDERIDSAVQAAQNARAATEKAIADAKLEADRLATEAKDLAIKVAETARITTVLSAFILAASALVAAAAAYMGAIRGGQHRDEGRIFAGLAYRR